MKLRLFGTVFELSYPLAAAITALIILDGSESVFICLLAAVMHESGHIAAMRLFGDMPERIRLSLFDAAIIDRKKSLRNGRKEIVIVLSGIAVNYLSAAAGLVLYLFLKQEWLIAFVTAHLALGLFNSLPVDSLDGGQAVMILLLHFFSPERSERILTVISAAILIPVACAGFLLLFHTRYNFTLLFAALYLIAIMFLKNKKLPLLYLSSGRIFIYTRNPVPNAAIEAASATTISGSLKYARIRATAVPTAAVMKFPVL